MSNILFEEERDDVFVNIIAGVISFLALLAILWGMWGALTLPTVHKSTSRYCIVAVVDYKGDPLPLHPLPKKYELIYVD
ncbi:MAG: hypothetical protein ABIG87_01450 [Patescibacteria group bacterium]